MVVHNYRLPISLERGATSGRRRKTTLVESKAGFESRNRDWVKRRGEWNLTTGVQVASDILLIRDLHDLVGGRADGWLYVDPSDHFIGDPDDPTSSGGDQVIGTGDDVETDFLFSKLVDIPGSGIPTYSHRIFKPLNNGTWSVLIDGVVQVSDFTIDYDTGIVTFYPAPAGGEIISIAGEHAYPVRFDIEMIEIVLVQFTDDDTDIDLAAIGDIPIVELRLKEPTP